MMERSVSVVVDRFCYFYTNLHSSGSRSIELKSDGSSSFYPDKTKLVWKEEKGVKSQKCSNNKGQKILSNIFPAKKKATVLLSANELLSAIMKMAVYNGVVFFSHKKDFKWFVETWHKIWELPWEDFQWETIMNNFKSREDLTSIPFKRDISLPSYWWYYMALKMLPWDICPRYWWQKQLEHTHTCPSWHESKESDDESIKKLVLSALKDFNIETDKIIAYTIDNAFHAQLTMHWPWLTQSSLWIMKCYNQVERKMIKTILKMKMTKIISRTERYCCRYWSSSHVLYGAQTSTIYTMS